MDRNAVLWSESIPWRIAVVVAGLMLSWGAMHVGDMLGTAVTLWFWLGVAISIIAFFGGGAIFLMLTDLVFVVKDYRFDVEDTAWALCVAACLSFVFGMAVTPIKNGVGTGAWNVFCEVLLAISLLPTLFVVVRIIIDTVHHFRRHASTGWLNARDERSK